MPLDLFSKNQEKREQIRGEKGKNQEQKAIHGSFVHFGPLTDRVGYASVCEMQFVMFNLNLVMKIF